MEYLGLAGYAANEGAGTIQGSISKMSAAWTDWMAELAKPDADMGRVTENLASSFVDVANNVVPALSNAISTALPQIPEVVMQVAPVLGESLLQVVDAATGGMGTQVVEALAPITEAVTTAFSGIGDWLAQNSGTLSTIGSQFAEIGGKISSALGGAISAVAPVIANLASGVLPILSSALTFLSGAISGAVNFITNMASALSPLVEAVSPVAEAIGGALCEGLNALGNLLGQLDFSGFAEGLKTAIEGVVSFVEGVIGTVTGFFDSVASFIQDPVGTIQEGFSQLIGGSDGVNSAVSNNFAGVANGVASGTGSAIGSINKMNSTKVKSQSATVKATGNVIDGTAKTKTDNTKSSINNLSGKNVTVSANGNAIDGGASRGLQDTINHISWLSGKSVDVVTNQITRHITEGGKAMGAIIPRHADGFIAAEPTLTDVGWIGEAGAEAVYSNGRSTGIFPLTNRRFTGPFASEISQQVLDGMDGGAGDVNVYLDYDAGADAQDMARDIARELRRMRLVGVM